jgi:inner membrane protein
MLARLFKNSIGLRMIIIALLTLVMLVPSAFVEELITERQQRRDGVVNEVSEKWGGVQTVSGPMLSVPYKSVVQTQYVDEKNVTRTKTEQVTLYAHLLPDTLTIQAELKPEVRYRGIYQIVLYRSVLKIRGRISLAGLREVGVNMAEVQWNDIVIALGIGDVKGIRDSVAIDWNGTRLLANPGIPTNDVVASGIAARPAITATDAANTAQYEFTIDLNLNGSGELYFVPLGRETNVSVKAPWATPSFVGAYLPEGRDVKDSAFAARWKVLHLNRNYPQQWTGAAASSVKESAFGVKLMMALDEYQKTFRSAKYAIMFIALTFLAFFMAETLNKKVIHPIQYTLIGLALVIFYTLLVSVSEQMSFNKAYVLSSAAVIALIGLYTRSVLQSNPATIAITGILVVLYGFLFIVLQLQDYALLMGSIGLFVILALVMYLTRRIDWFSLAEPPQQKATPPQE